MVRKENWTIISRLKRCVKCYCVVLPGEPRHPKPPHVLGVDRCICRVCHGDEHVPDYRFRNAVKRDRLIYADIKGIGIVVFDTTTLYLPVPEDLPAFRTTQYCFYMLEWEDLTPANKLGAQLLAKLKLLDHRYIQVFKNRKGDDITKIY